MRRIFTTLGITALLALLASPAMARPHSPNNTPTPSARHGWVAGQSRDGMRVERVRPAPYITPAKLRRAEAVRARYVAQKSRLLRQIRAQRRLVRSLKARPYRSRGRVRANTREAHVAKRRLRKLELKLSSLELMYQTRIARLMSPRAARYFNVTFG